MTSRILLVATFIVAASTGPTHAGTVTFSTDGTFDAGSSGGFVSADGRSLTVFGDNLAVIVSYTGASEMSLAVPSAATLGAFTLSVVGDVDRQLSLADAGFGLTVDQTVPEAATGMLTGTLGGAVGLDAQGLITGFLTLTFDRDTLGLGLIRYDLLGTSSNALVLIPGSGIGGTTPVIASVTAIPTPRGLVLSSIGLFSVGLVAVGRGLSRRHAV